MQHQLEQLETDSGIEWQAFKIGDLFEKLNLRFLKDKFDKEKDISKQQCAEFNLPLVNAKNGNNGIMYYGRSKDFESTEMSIDIVNDGAISTGNVYSQPQKTGVLYNAYLIKSKAIINQKSLHFFTTTIQKSIKLKFGYENKASWEKVKLEKIQLPTTNGSIAFEFMEQFIATLQAERLATLQAERLATLQAYLTTTGLTDTVLTEKEQAALDALETVKWGAFKVGELFEIRPTKNYGLSNSDLLSSKGNIPVVSNTSVNNGITGYINLKPTEKGNMITFSDTTTDESIFYQPHDFVGYSHIQGMHKKIDADIGKQHYLFIVSAFKKAVRGKYNYGTKFNRDNAAKEKIQLPTTANNTPDYAFMELLITAMQKVVIKNVVDYLDTRIDTTARVIK